MLDQVQKRFAGDSNAGARVVQQVFILIRPEKRIDRNRNGADFYGSEKTIGKFGNIRQQEENSFLHANIQRVTQGSSEAIDAIGELRIGDPLVFTFDCDTVTAAFPQMAVDKILGGIKELRNSLVRDGHEERVYLSIRRQGIGILAGPCEPDGRHRQERHSAYRRRWLGEALGLSVGFTGY